MLRLVQLRIVLLLLAAASTAWGVFEVEMPLESLVTKSELIAVVRVAKLDRAQERATLVVERLLKGSDIERFPVRLKGDGDGHPLDMLARIDEGMQLVVFTAPVSASESMLFAYTTDSWFKLRGSPQRDVISCQFVQGEPYLRKTYGGEVEELVKLVEDSITGRGKLPEINKDAKPGLGKTFFELTPPPASSDAVTAVIDLSPAWTGDVPDRVNNESPDVRRYGVAAVLGLAGIGFLFLLTRSQPSDSAP